MKASIWALLFVVLLGAAFRLYDIQRNPSELISDELDLYNSARSIATTGHDVDGSLMPFLFCSFTRNPPMYAVVGYVTSLVLGNGPFGLRFPAVVFGLIAIVWMFAIAYELTRRWDVAVVTALLLATCPIFIHFSRIGWEPASELPFLLGGVYLSLRVFLRAGDGDGMVRGRLSSYGLLGAALLLGLTSYTYMAGWFYAVALGGGMVLLNLWRLRSGRAWLGVVGAVLIWLLVSLPALWMWFNDPYTYERTARISTFGNGVTLAAMQTFVFNYVAHFRWSYLVTTGDPVAGTTWRYLNGFGAFYWWVVLLAALGVFVSPRFVRVRWALVWVFLWLLVYPLGGALTNEAVPNAPRTLAGTPVFCLLAAFGFAALVDAARKLRSESWRVTALFAARAFLVVNLVVSLMLFSLFYFREYVHIAPNAWDSGTRDTFALIRKIYPHYDRMCFQVRQAWYETDTYFRYYLHGINIRTYQDLSDPACSLPGTLLVADNAVPRLGFKPIATTVDVNGDAFAVLEGRPRVY